MTHYEATIDKHGVAATTNVLPASYRKITYSCGPASADHTPSTEAINCPLNWNCRRNVGSTLVRVSPRSAQFSYNSFTPHEHTQRSHQVTLKGHTS